MHHKNEVAKIMNDLVKGQGLDIGPEIKKVHEIMDEYRFSGRYFTELEIEQMRSQAYEMGFQSGSEGDINLYSIS